MKNRTLTIIQSMAMTVIAIFALVLVGCGGDKAAAPPPEHAASEHPTEHPQGEEQKEGESEHPAESPAEDSAEHPQ